MVFPKSVLKKLIIKSFEVTTKELKVILYKYKYSFYYLDLNFLIFQIFHQFKDVGQIFYWIEKKYLYYNKHNFKKD